MGRHLQPADTFPEL